MIDLKNVMVLWADDDESPNNVRPKVKCVNYLDSKQISRFDYLTSSNGACCAGWEEASDVDRAAYIMCLFNEIVVREDIDAKDVHNAFMEITEYANFHHDPHGEEPYYKNPFFKLSNLPFGGSR